MKREGRVRELITHLDLIRKVIFEIEAHFAHVESWSSFTRDFIPHENIHAMRVENWTPCLNIMGKLLPVWRKPLCLFIISSQNLVKRIETNLSGCSLCVNFVSWTKYTRNSTKGVKSPLTCLTP